MEVKPITPGTREKPDLSISILLNPRLMPSKKTLKYKQIIDELVNYVQSNNIFTASKRLPELDTKALINIITNLLIADGQGKLLAYYRNRNAYSTYHKSYGYGYFRYDRYIKIINGLIAAGIVENFEGYFDKLTGKGKNSRMRLARRYHEIISGKVEVAKLSDLDYYFITSSGNVRNIGNNGLVRTVAELPKIVVVLKDKRGNSIDYKLTVKLRKMVSELNKYNDFIKAE